MRLPKLPRPRLSRPRLPRVRPPRVHLPRPPEAVIEAGRVPVDLGRDGWDWWLSLSIYTRRRLGLVVGLLAVIGLIWLVAIPALPCQAPGGDSCPAGDHAIGLVPDDALAYAHANLDRGGDQFEAAQDVAARVPTLAQQAINRLESMLPGPDGGPVDFDRDIAPWFGGEVALAILPAGGRAAQEVQLLGVADTDGARRFADSIASGGVHSRDIEGVELQVDRRGLATALVGDFLAIGAQSGVRAVIDVDRGADGTESLAADPDAGGALGALPAGRLAEVYLSKDGIARLVAERGSALATLAPVIDPGASKGAAAALVANDDGLGLNVRSILDPARVPAHGGFLSALPRFEPSLPGSLPADSLAYLGIGDPGETIGSLLKEASASEPGLAAIAGELTKSLKAVGDVGLERELGPVLGEEGALALEPSGRGGTQTPIPVFIGSGIDESRAGEALARLRRQVAKALGSGADAPGFKRRSFGDVAAYSLAVSPTVELTYAIVGQTLVIGTDPAGVRAVIDGGPGLDQSEPFRGATAGLPSEVSTLGYLDLGGLIALAERAGLAGTPAYATFAPEIRRLQALGVAIQGTEDQLATDARLVVAEDAGAADDNPPGAPPD